MEFMARFVTSGCMRCSNVDRTMESAPLEILVKKPLICPSQTMCLSAQALMSHSEMMNTWNQ